MNEKIYDIGIVQSQQELDAVLCLRRAVFVEEEGVPQHKEFDGNDYVGAVHFFVKDNNVVVGTLRMRLFPDFIKLERLCLDKMYRSGNAAKQLLEYSTAFCEHKGYKKINALCTKPLLGFWQRNGYVLQRNVPPLHVGNMELYSISKDITSDRNHPAIDRPDTLVTTDSNSTEDYLVRKKIPYILAALKKAKQES